MNNLNLPLGGFEVPSAPVARAVLPSFMGCFDRPSPDGRFRWWDQTRRATQRTLTEGPVMWPRSHVVRGPRLPDGGQEGSLADATGGFEGPNELTRRLASRDGESPERIAVPVAATGLRHVQVSSWVREL